MYERLNVSIIERGESFYQDKMKEVVEDLSKRGVLEDDDGRKIMWADKIEVTIMGKNGESNHGPLPHPLLKKKRAT